MGGERLKAGGKTDYERRDGIYPGFVELTPRKKHCVILRMGILGTAYERATDVQETRRDETRRDQIGLSKRICRKWRGRCVFWVIPS